MNISTGAQKKALVVGISDYTNLQKLDFCKNDGREVYDVLTSLGYEISDENKLIGKAIGTKVKDAIYDFFVCLLNSLLHLICLEIILDTSTLRSTVPRKDVKAIILVSTGGIVTQTDIVHHKLVVAT